jgi:GT2 family glycosyltransferase
MKLGVVILNWNNATDTITCVHSIRAWNHEQDTYVIVVDNHSRPGEASSIRDACPEAVLIQNEDNYGFAGGTNIGIEAALRQHCDAILLLNNDIRMSSGSIQVLIDDLMGDEQIGIIGPILYDEQNRASAGGRDIARHSRTHVPVRPSVGRFLDVDYVPGAVALIRRDVFSTVGFLDEDYFFGGEVADFCDRAAEAGCRIVIDSHAEAFHSLERSQQLRRTLHQYYTLRNRFIFVRKRRGHSKAYLFTFWTLIGLLRIFRSLVNLDVVLARIYVLGLWDGLTGRIGGQNERVLRTMAE